MAWHVFEKLLEGVANYSTFIGKIWITFLFIFRIIMVASVGDTVYNDEQSNFICNTMQPGCINVCFNKFSPISQIRFWAVQILFVGTPSVVFIVYAMHKMSDPSLQDKKDDEKASRGDKRSEGRQSVDHNGKSTRRRHENDTSEKSVDGKTSLPHYDDLAMGAVEKRSVNGVARTKLSNKPSSQHSSRETVFDGKQRLAEIIYIPPETKERKKPEVKRKTVFHKDGQSEVVKTPSIARAYLAQTIVRTAVEAIFLYLQYYMYSFQVNELYVCERDPCPKKVDCYVSRPKEKTLFLQFMYVMTLLSIVLNIIELVQLAIHFCRGRGSESQGLKRLYIGQSYNYGDYRRGGGRRRRRRRRDGAYPTIGPYPRKHGNSFTDTEGNDSIQSDYSFYED